MVAFFCTWLEGPRVAFEKLTTTNSTESSTSSGCGSGETSLGCEKRASAAKYEWCKEWMKNIFWDWKDQEDKRVVFLSVTGKGRTSFLVLPAMAIFQQVWWSPALNELVRNSLRTYTRLTLRVWHTTPHQVRTWVSTNENLDNLSTLRWKEKMCPLTVQYVQKPTRLGTFRVGNLHTLAFFPYVLACRGRPTWQSDCCSISREKPSVKDWWCCSACDWCCLLSRGRVGSTCTIKVFLHWKPRKCNYIT